MVFILQPVFAACPITRESRIVNHPTEVRLLFTAVSFIQRTRTIEKGIESPPVPVLPG